MIKSFVYMVFYVFVLVADSYIEAPFSNEILLAFLFIGLGTAEGLSSLHKKGGWE